MHSPRRRENSTAAGACQDDGGVRAGRTPMARLNKVKLLFGPYKPPPLKRGDRAYCLFRGAPVVVTGCTDAPIPWPLCHLAGYRRPCGRGILVDDELARAICHESVTAVKYWWGVSRNTARRWRGAFGVGRRDNEGTHRLVLGAIQANMDTRAATTAGSGRATRWRCWAPCLTPRWRGEPGARRTP